MAKNDDGRGGGEQDRIATVLESIAGLNESEINEAIRIKEVELNRIKSEIGRLRELQRIAKVNTPKKPRKPRNRKPIAEKSTAEKPTVLDESPAFDELTAEEVSDRLHDEHESEMMRA